MLLFAAIAYLFVVILTGDEVGNIDHIACVVNKINNFDGVVGSVIIKYVGVFFAQRYEPFFNSTTIRVCLQAYANSKSSSDFLSALFSLWYL